MRDAISIPRIQQLHPAVRVEVFNGITNVELGLPANMAIRVVEWYRTFSYQDFLYSKGRDKQGKVINKSRVVTNAKGGEGYHCYGFAFDYALLIDRNGDGKYDELSWDVAKDSDKDGLADWREVANYFVGIGWRWGADWDGDGITKAQGDSDEHLVDAPHLEKTFGLHWREMLRRYNAGLFIPGTKYIQL